MGFGFYLFWPAFYTDVTDSYRLGRAGRVRTDLGGLYFNALVVLGVFAVWWLTGWHAVLLIVATQILQMTRQLLPLLRFDGYHVLADLTGVPDLYQRIGPVMSGLLPGRWHQPEATALKPWARAVVVAWILLVVPLMAGSLLLMVLALPRVLATAWSGVQRQAGLAGAAFGDGDVLGVLARALAVVALALPVLGLGYVLVRLVRSAATGVWRRTEGRPVRRGVALLLAAALVVGLGWAWWPAADRYRPVRAWEGGTVLDAVPAASSGRLDVGSQGSAPTIWPEDAGPLPTADRPALAMVLVPTADGAASEGDAAAEAPTWVFPFNRPLPPGEGDNQALAVNTEDGSVAYDVTFALVWGDEDAALNRNEAYALASCRDCRTVAVAFQVVLVVGAVDVVVPQNLAAAVNYACVECVTYALATQLVVTLEGPLREDGARELAAIWAELAEFGEQIEDVPLDELRDRLTAYEARILEVVRADAEVAGADPAEATDPAEPTADDPAVDDPAADPSDGSAPSAGPTGAATSPSSGSAAPGGEETTSSSPPEQSTAPPPTSSAPAVTSAGPETSTASG
jgi:putative peptide zinc metalloprotease protein